MTPSNLAKREARAIGTTMWFRFHPMMVKRAKGAQVWDNKDRAYLDFVSQWGVTNIGNSHPEVVEAIKRQSKELIFSSHVTFPNIPTIELAEKLIKITPGKFSKKVWFGLSGSDTGEYVFKVLPAYTGRKRILSFYGSYHGSNIGGITVSGHKSLNKYIGMGNSIKIPYPYPYRCSLCTYSNCTLACVDYAEEQILSNYDSNDISCVIVEPVQSDAGEIVPPKDFLPRLQKFCRGHGIKFVDDEVKVGMGRTGKMLAAEHSGVTPDALMLGKPLASGMPLSAVIGRSEIMDAASTTHLYTLSGHPVSCVAALATIKVLERERLVERAAKTGAYLLKRMKELEEGHRLVGEARGLGMILGVELVKNKTTKKPAPVEGAAVVFRAWQLGLLIGLMGTRGNVIEIMPPLNITGEEADKGANILERAISDVEKGRVDKESVKRFVGS